MSTEERTRPVSELFDQAMKSYEHTLKTGLKLQEESSRFFNTLMSQTASPQDWPKRMKAMTDEFLPETQRSAEEGLKLMEQASRASIDLLKKAVAAGQSTTWQDAQVKFLGLWEASLKSMRDTVAAVTQSQSKAMESWAACARKTGEPAAATPKS